MRYFAYGSNMLPARLRERAPTARRLVTARLPGWRLEFSKLGRDGSGKCGVRRTGADQDCVHGVLFELSTPDCAALDAVEGEGYLQAWMTLQSDHESVAAMLYLPRPEHTRADLQPFHWYRELVLQGASSAALPAAYRARIAAVASRADPDEGRERNALRLLPARR